MDHGNGDGPTKVAVARALLLLGVAVPAVVLVLLFAASELVGVSFGDVIFALTIVAVVVWLGMTGWGRRADAASPMGAFLWGSDERYGEEMADGGGALPPMKVTLYLVMTGTIVLGWIVLIVVFLPRYS